MPPTTRSKAEPKIQAKLDFTPVSKDSAQAQQLAASVRSRASAVRYISPKKARASRNASTKLGGKDKQQRLQLSSPGPRPNATPFQSDPFPSTDDRVYASQRRSSPGIGSWLRRRIDTSPRQDPHLTSTSSGQTAQTWKFSGQVLQSSPPKYGAEDASENAGNDLPERTAPEVEILDDEEDSEPDLTFSSARIQTRKTVLESDSEDDSELPASTARHRVIIEKRGKAANDNEEDESSLSEDELVLPSSTRKSRRFQNSILVSDDEEESISSSVHASKRSHAKSTHAQTSSSPTKRRRLQSGPKPRRMTREERDEEVLEDAQDLQDTETLHQGLRSASKLNEKKLARQRQLSKLAARRNKGAITIDSSSSPEPEDDLLPVPYNDVYSDDNSSQADSLIDDDDNDALSTTSSTSEIRINRSIYDIPSALYYTIQELLHKKLDPSHHIPSDEHPLANYFTTAQSLISKRLESYANQFISSIWRKEFNASLHARPRISWPRNELTIWDSCEACGRRDHPARYVMRFDGDCYDEHTLDPVDEEASSAFTRFNTQVPEEAVWHVGADCHDKAWRAHRATHWRYGLAVQIDKALAMMGVEIDNTANGTLDDAANQISRADSPDLDINPRSRRAKARSERRDIDEQDTAANGSEADKQDVVANGSVANEQEDRYQAVLLQLEEQGYIEALQREFLERFEMVNEDDEDD